MRASGAVQNRGLKSDRRGFTLDLMERFGRYESSGSRGPSFVGERVLHWCDLRDGGGKGARTIIRGAHGYPLNAFLTSRSSAELGLVDRRQAPKALSQLVVESLLAVVVSAFDGESFLIWAVL